jgi:hypothetical protein
VTDARGAQVANGLHRERKDDASERRGVMCVRPDHRKDADGYKQESSDEQARLAVAEQKRQGGKKQELAEPKVSVAAAD